MKREELKELGLEKELIDKVMALHGVDVENNKAKLTELETLLAETKSQNEELSNKVNEFTGTDEELTELKKQIEDYKTKEQERLELETKTKLDQELTSKILEVIGDKKFTSEYAKNGFINDIKKVIETDTTIGIDKAFEKLSSEKEGLFAPEHEKVKLPSTGDNAPKTPEMKHFF